MDSNLRSSDYYYRDRKPEVSTPPTSTPTYHQSSSLNSSNNKYYAEMAPLVAEDTPIIAKLQMPPKKEVELEILDACYGLATIQAAFEAGATIILVKTYEYIISQLQVAVDMSVGRGELTRDQIDSIVFVTLSAEDILVEPEVPIIKEEVAPPIEGIPEAASILNDAPKQSRKKTKSTKTTKSDEITLKDIAAAFGGDDSDD